MKEERKILITIHHQPTHSLTSILLYNEVALLPEFEALVQVGSDGQMVRCLVEYQLGDSHV